ncbi:Hypothetical protein PBC10988_36290 [Planctomycetales bacterium 10988]|nr:Hypothetical protein PBC10988_36290 [Planctomycetales bacterium 10988]
MGFLYQCPSCQQELSGEASFAGQQVQCPYCQAAHVHPKSPDAAGSPLDEDGLGMGAGYEEEADEDPLGDPDAPVMGEAFGGGLGGGLGDDYDEGGEDEFGIGGEGTGMEESDGTLSIPCPKCGQVLPTPPEMLGEDAACPYCNEVMTLRKEDSLEYKKEREEYYRMKDEEFSRKALNWAITASILVGISLIGMFLFLIFA